MEKYKATQPEENAHKHIYMWSETELWPLCQVSLTLHVFLIVPKNSKYSLYAILNEIPLICFYSLEDPGNSDPEESRDEPNTFQESYDDINVDHLLNNFQLVGYILPPLNLNLRNVKSELLNQL